MIGKRESASHRVRQAPCGASTRQTTGVYPDVAGTGVIQRKKWILGCILALAPALALLWVCRQKLPGSRRGTDEAARVGTTNRIPAGDAGFREEPPATVSGPGTAARPIAPPMAAGDREGRIEGMVIDPDRTPIAGALVRIATGEQVVGEGAAQLSAAMHRVKPDSKKRLRAVPPGNYRFDFEIRCHINPPRWRTEKTWAGLQCQAEIT
jgi:hypothetical protein